MYCTAAEPHSAADSEKNYFFGLFLFVRVLLLLLFYTPTRVSSEHQNTPTLKHLGIDWAWLRLLSLGIFQDYHKKLFAVVFETSKNTIECKQNISGICWTKLWQPNPAARRRNSSDAERWGKRVLNIGEILSHSCLIIDITMNSSSAPKACTVQRPLFLSEYMESHKVS